MPGLAGGAAALALLAALAWFPDSASAQTEAKENGYIGAEACRECHKTAMADFEATRKGRLFLKHPRTEAERHACENCHGPAKLHKDTGGDVGPGLLITFKGKFAAPVEERNKICLSCHAKGNRVGNRIFWNGSAHDSRDVACTSCHSIMKGQLVKVTEIETCGQCHTQRRAQLMRSSHMPVREGKMTCTSCHNPHGTATEKLLKANSVNETCYTCHAEKRGPFLWEHPPVMESCSNCHDPHGSNHEKLLKIAKPRLCQQCHVETRHPTTAQRIPQVRFVFNRSCTNCHSQIHGTNHPSAAGRFQR
jgi:DmsE family decaheme c-type cytochrome